uniref:Heat shock transcription factor 2 n=1 Tax=Acanthochromis polyacanthus TaxID=80966 RepID=A0A3Q1GF82_9TELE
MKQNSTVPAFLTKLWTLVEDGDTNEFICWSQNAFAFELCVKTKKFSCCHLCADGFRKVMHIDTGIVKQERDGPVEFQHPYFKHGQDDLLENIKRKVSNTRPEDNKIRQDDLTKILASVHSVHSKQENIDARLATLKRENEALWREISDLRQKHSHQQQLIKKLVQFIVTLVQNNRILNLKRKRPILMNSNGKKSKYIHQIYEDKQSTVNGLNGVKNSEVSEDIIICDLTENEAEVMAEITEESPRAFEQGDVEIVEVEVDSCGVLPTETEVITSDDDKPAEDGKRSSSLDGSKPTSSSLDGNKPISSALQLNKASGLSLEDPVKMMDSILNENGAISQNINLLGKVELMDYLDSIDCSLEDFQAMLYGKQFGIDFEAVEVKHSNTRAEMNTTDKQLIQYTSCPLLAFLDGCTPPAELDLGSSSSSSHLHPSVEAEPPSELLDIGLEAKQPHRSSLIRLEPLTEAEASEETLFYLYDLSPSDAESGQLCRSV